MPKETIFISDSAELKLRVSKTDRDGKPFSNELIAKFNPFFTMDKVRGETVKKGYIKTSDEKLIKQLESYPSYGKDFKKVDRLPEAFSGQSVVYGVVTSTPAAPNQADIEKKVEKTFLEKLHRYNELKKKVLTKEGSVSGNASKQDVEEFNELKKYFGEIDEG